MLKVEDSNSEKVFYEKKKIDDLWVHYDGVQSQSSDTY